LITVFGTGLGTGVTAVEGTEVGTLVLGIIQIVGWCGTV